MEGQQHRADSGLRGQKNLIAQMPGQLRSCLEMGGSTTLMVWADVDHDMPDAEALKNEFWIAAQAAGISREQFDRVVFVFAKDRLENWIEFLLGGATDEAKEGPRVEHDRSAAEAARCLADKCQSGAPIPNVPPSLEWSCKNWRALKQRLSSC